MARLNLIIESDDDDDDNDEFPDISTLLAAATAAAASNPPGGGKKEMMVPCETRTKFKKDGGDKVTSMQLQASTTTANPEFRRQRPLKLAHVNSLLLPLVKEKNNRRDGTSSVSPDRSRKNQIDKKKPCGLLGRGLSLVEKSPKSEDGVEKEAPDEIWKRASPRRKAAQISSAYFHVRSPDHRNSSGLLPMGEDNSSEENMSGFIVSQSESDMEAPPVRSPRRKMKEGFSRESESRNKTGSSAHSVIVDLLSPCGENPRHKRPETPPSGPSHEVFDEDCLGRLRFSPPRSKTPHRRRESEKLLTPPCSPSKPDLQSPSKRSYRIPPSPQRPSIDAFWSQEIINDWNDQHSPRKPKFPQKLFSIHNDNDEAYLSPSTSPWKSPAKTPGRKDKAAVERKRAFDERKAQLAVDFLKELDLKVADGRVGVLAESAGGVKVIWSKKLHSTAGRANWKRETLVSRNPEGAGMKIYRHHASIELAEKVIDDEERLVNVLAHEYCHLANFMISGIKNNPHGKEFKEWAAKTTRLFSHRNITVTTKHTYAIAYKYIWACTSAFCGLEYKRHSKSIDPAKHSCGACKGKLVQIQPAPRKGKSRDEGKTALSAYQIYVKSNSARVRRENPGLGLGEVMKKLGEEFRDVKARKLEENESSNEPLVGSAAVDDDELELDGENNDSADEMFKKLHLLKLA